MGSDELSSGVDASPPGTDLGRCPRETDVVVAISTSPPGSDWWPEHLAECPRCRAVAAPLLNEGPLRGTLRQIEGTRRTLRPPSLAGYEVVREVGRGGQGIVYEAIQSSTGRHVALKVLPPSATLAARGRMQRELEILKRLDRPGLVRLYDSGDDGDGTWFAMELVDGLHLDDWLQGGQPIRERMRVIEGVARTLHFVHVQGILHRDLKPSNVLVDSLGNPWILDFGLGKPDQRDDASPRCLTTTGAFAGTVAFSSPEQLAREGRESIDARSDVYTLALLGYLAATGTHPFADADGLAELVAAVTEGCFSSPRTRDPRIDRDLDSILIRGMACDPADRYQSADAFAEDLKRWQCSEPVDARGGGAAYQLLRLARRYRGAVTAALAAVLVVGFLIGQGTSLWQRAERAEREGEDLAVLVAARDLEVQQEAFWPGFGAFGERGDAWIQAADALIAKRPSLIARQAAFDVDDTSWSSERLDQLVARLDRVATLRSSVQWRVSNAPERLGRDAAWDAVEASLRTESELTDVVAFHPALRPLRRHPKTDAWEAWHPFSGERPTWDERRGRWLIEPETAMVFVLVEEGRGKLDSTAMPTHWVCKYPVTIGQWERLNGELELDAIDGLFPISGVAPEEAGRVLARSGLGVPERRRIEVLTVERARSGRDAAAPREQWIDHSPDRRQVEVHRLRPDSWGIHGRYSPWWELARDRWRHDDRFTYVGSNVMIGRHSTRELEWIRPVLEIRGQASESARHEQREFDSGVRVRRRSVPPLKYQPAEEPR